MLTASLTRLLGRLPIGLLQLFHNPARLLAALAGVAFANVLVFVQLGLAGSMTEAVATPYRLFKPDLLIVSDFDAEAFMGSATLPRQWLYTALSHPEVAEGTPVYLAGNSWTAGNDTSSSIQMLGLRPDAAAFVRDDVAPLLENLVVEDTALVDAQTRFRDMRAYAAASLDAPVPLELQNRQLNAIGNLSIGGGFGGDGVFMVSDQTFFHLFPRRSAGSPSHLLLALSPGADPERVAAELLERYPEKTVRIRSISTAITAEQRYQLTRRPTGAIFAVGVVIGIVVGIVIAYQVLATDVANHLREYATLKAMGYRQQFFAGIVLEEALILAALGFWPGYFLSQLLYDLLVYLANVPIFMTPGRAIAVFVGTVLACSLSGMLAMRRLAAADPAELF